MESIGARNAIVIDNRLYGVAVIGGIRIENYGRVAHKISGKTQNSNGVAVFSVRLQWMKLRRL
jgi:hypothetical protein